MQTLIKGKQKWLYVLYNQIKTDFRQKNMPEIEKRHYVITEKPVHQGHIN